jgi:hypothetical protein
VESCEEWRVAKSGELRRVESCEDWRVARVERISSGEMVTSSDLPGSVVDAIMSSRQTGMGMCSRTSSPR